MRDLGLSLLGLFKARVGAGVEKYLTDLNQQKLGKVTEAAAEVKLTKYDKPKQQKVKPAAKAKPEPAKAEDDFDADAGPAAKPKKKKKGGPPASFFERQQKMQDKAQEKFEELKAELGGGPAPAAADKSPKLAAAKPEPEPPSRSQAETKPSAPARNKPKIAVDNSGPGVAKEDAVNIMTEKAPAGILKQFDEAKWQDKKEAYANLATWINEQEYSNELFEAAFWFIRIQLKEFKEKNVNIVKAAI